MCVLSQLDYHACRQQWTFKCFMTVSTDLISNGIYSLKTMRNKLYTVTR